MRLTATVIGDRVITSGSAMYASPSKTEPYTDWDEPHTPADLAESHWSFAQLRAGDHVTNTVAEGEAFERARSMAFDDHYDYARPTKAELDAEEKR